MSVEKYLLVENAGRKSALVRSKTGPTWNPRRMKSMRTALKQILMFTLITGLLYLIFCLAISPRIPYSRCFKHDEKKLKARIEMYARTALKSIEDYKIYRGNKGPVFTNPNAKKLCVSIASVGREKVKYLEQTVATLLTRTPLSYQDRIQMTLYNLDVPASKHVVAKSLSSIIRVQDASYLSVDPDAGKITRENVKTKEFLDYVALLSEEEKRGCDHYLVLEDDVLASKDWANTVMDIIKQVEKEGENYSMVKLFGVAKFGSDVWSWRKPFDIFLITIIAIAFTVVIYGLMIGIAWLVKRIRGKNSDDDNVKKPTILEEFSQFNLISALFLLVCCVSFVIFIDKKSVIYWPKGIYKSDIGALYQANLYTKDALSRWNAYLRAFYDFSKTDQRPLRAKDLYVRGFNSCEMVNGKEFVHMMYRPSVFQHTGIKSAVGNDRNFDDALLSYTFPDDDTPIDFDQKFLES